MGDIRGEHLRMVFFIHCENQEIIMIQNLLVSSLLYIIIDVTRHWLYLFMVIIFLVEDTSKPKFVNSERGSAMNQLDPVTLHIQRKDETTMKAVKLFARQVVLILHTCNVNEYCAALETLEPPTHEDGSNIQDQSIIYPQVGSVIGWFAGYRTAVVRTGQGNKCRDELTVALTKSFPNGKGIIGAGIAYANSQKCKFADVLISDQIENFVQYKIVDGKITNRGPREQIDPNVQRIFENPARDWTDMKHFPCADDNRTSVSHIGCIVSTPTLLRDKVLRDQLMKHTPDCIGGEMEGWVLLELKRTLKVQHNRDIEVIVIKGVADYGDCTNRDKWQWTAAKAAMDCIHYCLSKSGGIEFGGKWTFHSNYNVGIILMKNTTIERFVITECISTRLWIGDLFSQCTYVCISPTQECHTSSWGMS